MRNMIYNYLKHKKFHYNKLIFDHHCDFDLIFFDALLSSPLPRKFDEKLLCFIFFLI